MTSFAMALLEKLGNISSITDSISFYLKCQAISQIICSLGIIGITVIGGACVFIATKALIEAIKD